MLLDYVKVLLEVSLECSLIKHTCSWHDKLIVLWTLSRGVKIFLPIQAYGSIMCEYFRFGFIDLRPKKSLIDYTNLISSNEYEKTI